MKNARETYALLFTLFPQAQIDTDNDGQVIVYTNMREVGRDPATNQPLTLEPIEESE